MLLGEALRHIQARGYADDAAGGARGLLSVPVNPRDLIARYQRYQGLPETGVLTPETEARLAAPRCGQPDIMAVSQESAWGLTELTYWQEIRYPGVDPDELATDYALAVQRVTDVCGLTVTEAPSASAAQIVAQAGNIDGPWNVLALSELPPPGNERLVLNQRFDVAEIGLTRAQRQAMMAHEFCHALGLGHAPPSSGALMAPILASVLGPQAWDIAELQRRYGPPVSTPSPVPVPVPPAPSPPTQAGPAVDSILVTIPKVGHYQYTFGFDQPGSYLLLIVPYK
jgi:hypothetical protein